MPENLIDEHLDMVDEWTATRERETPPGYDEWNAINIRMGRPRGSFTAYRNYCANHVSLFSYDTQIYFGAIDDDDFIGEMK